MGFEKLINLAKEIATEAHKEQKRWDKITPYIIHPETVARNCITPDCIVAAWLHDVIEDTDLTYDDLEAKGIPRRITQIIAYLTKIRDESYAEYIFNIKTDPAATEVKIADLKHNLSDLKKGSMRDKYELALRILEGED